MASEAIGRGFESLRARHLPLLPPALAGPVSQQDAPQQHPSSQSSPVAQRLSRRHSAMADRPRVGPSHSNPCSARIPASFSTRCMVNNWVASRDQLPSSQRHVAASTRGSFRSRW